MKNIRLRSWSMKLSVMVLLVITGIASFAQVQLPAGTYEVSLSKSVQLMNTDAKARYDSLPGHIKVKADESMTGKRFAFQENGSVTIQWNVNTVTKTAGGTWQLTNGGSKLVLAAGGLEIEYLVEWEGSDGLILRNTKAGGLFANLYLEKID